MGKLFEDIELVVEVVIHHHYAVILFQLLSQSFAVVKALAGGACQLEIGVGLADIVLQNGGYHDSLVEAVICKAHDHVAELVAEVLLFQSRICECEADGYAPVVERLQHHLHEFLVA